MTLRSDNPAIKAKVAAYLLINKEIADRKAEQDRIKKDLEPYLMEAETNARGSYVIPFSEPLEVLGKQYKELQRTRKVSKVLNEERVIAYLNQRAIDASPDGRPFPESRWYSPIVTVQHVDQDALWDLFAQEYISQEEFDSFFDETVSWSFNPTKV